MYHHVSTYLPIFPFVYFSIYIHLCMYYFITSPIWYDLVLFQPSELIQRSVIQPNLS